MPTINGKEVVFREKLESAKWWSLLPAIASMQQVDESLPEQQRGLAVGCPVSGPVAAMRPRGMMSKRRNRS